MVLCAPRVISLLTRYLLCVRKYEIADNLICDRNAVKGQGSNKVYLYLYTILYLYKHFIMIDIHVQFPPVMKTQIQHVF